MNEENNKKEFSQEEIELVASQVTTLFTLMAPMIPHRELVRKVAQTAAERASYAVSAAVLMPMNWQSAEKKENMVAKRGRLLYELLCALVDTESEYLAAKKDEQGRANMAKILGF